MLEILYQDDYLVAINKPAGMLVHRTNIAAQVDGPFALQELRNQLEKHVFPVHRLDRPTSGVLLFALDGATAKLLQSVLASEETEKQYLAVCRGYCPEEGTIEAPLWQEEKRKMQEAITHFRRLGVIELPIQVSNFPTSRYSLVHVSPKTGRMHQIRKHFAKIRHYLIGDTKHGDLKQNRVIAQEFDCHGLLLHAHKLTFNHPVTGSKTTIEAPLSPHFQKIIDAFSWQHLI